MAKYCSKCNTKIGFFDKLYEDKFCKECYEKIKFEESEIKRKAKLAQMLKEKEERKEKLNSARDYLLYTNYYLVIIKNIDLIPFHYRDIFTSSVKDKFDIIKILLDEIIWQLPKEFNLDDIKKITTYRKSAKIIDSVLKPYVKINLNYEKYYKILLGNQQYSSKPNYYILDDKEENSLWLFNSWIIDFDSTIPTMLESKTKTVDNLTKLIDDCIEKSKKPNKYDYDSCINLANEERLEQTYEIIYIYYYYAMMIIYYIYFNKTVDKIIKNSELYNVYTKLKKGVHNDNYIIDKLFPIYNSLYKNEFDIVFEDENEFRFLIETIQTRENVIEKQDFIDIDNTILNIDINKYINIYNDDELFYEISNEINTNMISYKSFLSISDVLDINIYSNRTMEIFNKVKQQQALIEKDRILKGDTQQEKEFVQDILDYSYIDNGYEFESFIANLYKLLGYEVLDVTSRSGDQGADVILKKDNLKYAVQVKFYSSPVGNKAVQEVVAGKNFYKTDKAMVVTNSTYTQQAKALAKANDVILIDGNALDKLIEEIKNKQE